MRRNYLTSEAISSQDPRARAGTPNRMFLVDRDGPPEVAAGLGVLERGSRSIRS